MRQIIISFDEFCVDDYKQIGLNSRIDYERYILTDNLRCL